MGGRSAGVLSAAVVLTPGHLIRGETGSPVIPSRRFQLHGRFIPLFRVDHATVSGQGYHLADTPTLYGATSNYTTLHLFLSVRMRGLRQRCPGVRFEMRPSPFQKAEHHRGKGNICYCWNLAWLLWADKQTFDEASPSGRSGSLGADRSPFPTGCSQPSNSHSSL